MQSRLLLLFLSLLPTACRAPQDTRSPERARWTYVPDLPVSRSPFETVHANYKERLEQPYAYVELRGSYARTGRALPALHDRVRAAGLEPNGPPFALYYDDPGRVAVDELRSRACVPLAELAADDGGLAFDVLPRAHVVYAVAAGPYPEVPRAYPALYRYLSSMGWVEAGPIREIYLVPPSAVANFDELLCEIQIPAAPRP